MPRLLLPLLPLLRHLLLFQNIYFCCCISAQQTQEAASRVGGGEVFAVRRSDAASVFDTCWKIIINNYLTIHYGTTPYSTVLTLQYRQTWNIRRTRTTIHVLGVQRLSRCGLQRRRSQIELQRNRQPLRNPKLERDHSASHNVALATAVA